jgi:septum formation protein
VLAADTVVVRGAEVIGKPTDLKDARKILTRLSGRTHEVYTSVFIARGNPKSRGERVVFTEMSHVTFHRLSAAAITEYFSKINPLDKAGAYAAQGHGREIIERIDGSYTNVVGLPMEKTIAALRAFGIEAQR